MGCRNRRRFAADWNRIPRSALLFRCRQGHAAVGVRISPPGASLPLSGTSFRRRGLDSAVGNIIAPPALQFGRRQRSAAVGAPILLEAWLARLLATFLTSESVDAVRMWMHQRGRFIRNRCASRRWFSDDAFGKPLRICVERAPKGPDRRSCGCPQSRPLQ